MTDLELLLCKVNKVTAYHRHGQKIPESALDDLANTQIEVEEAMRPSLEDYSVCDIVRVRE